VYSTATPPKPPSRLRRALGFTSLAVVAFFAGLSVAPFQAANKIMAVGIPTDEETLEIFQPVDELSQRIDEHIKTHALAQELRSQADFIESRPHLKIPDTLRQRNLTAGTLAGPDRIVVPPYVWLEKSGKELVSISYLGDALNGHPGIVHGGLLATMLDEGLARCCFPALPNRIGVTANLNIDYRQPVKADTYIVLRATTVKVEGRKAWVEGRLETLPEGDEEPVVLVEAKALFIEPKFASVCLLFPLFLSFRSHHMLNCSRNCPPSPRP
jgi:acyl-coenzyme A thioesterase PaaI-like protein